jgi:hypothetical protein
MIEQCPTCGADPGGMHRINCPHIPGPDFGKGRVQTLPVLRVRAPTPSAMVYIHRDLYVDAARVIRIEVGPRMGPPHVHVAWQGSGDVPYLARDFTCADEAEARKLARRIRRRVNRGRGLFRDKPVPVPAGATFTPLVGERQRLLPDTMDLDLGTLKIKAASGKPGTPLCLMDLEIEMDGKRMYNVRDFSISAKPGEMVMINMTMSADHADDAEMRPPTSPQDLGGFKVPDNITRVELIDLLRSNRAILGTDDVGGAELAPAQIGDAVEQFQLRAGDEIVQRVIVGGGPTIVTTEVSLEPPRPFQGGDEVTRRYEYGEAVHETDPVMIVETLDGDLVGCRWTERSGLRKIGTFTTAQIQHVREPSPLANVLPSLSRIISCRKRE